MCQQIWATLKLIFHFLQFQYPRLALLHLTFCAYGWSHLGDRNIQDCFCPHTLSIVVLIDAADPEFTTHHNTAPSHWIEELFFER